MYLIPQSIVFLSWKTVSFLNDLAAGSRSIKQNIDLKKKRFYKLKDSKLKRK